MPREVWKEYEENLVTHSAAHYLMTIRDLLDLRGYARVTDIAREMSITRGSCSISLKPLKRRGLVVEDDNKFLHLSEEGRSLAEHVARNDELLEAFFRDVLQVSGEQAEIDACKIEHLLSIESSLRLAKFIEYIQSDRKAVKEFRRGLKRSVSKCPGDVEKCSFCNTDCVDSVVKKKAPVRRRKKPGPSAKR